MTFDKDNEYLFDETESLEDKIIKNEDNRLLFNSLKKLKPEYEKVIYLVALEELSYKEIGKILGKTLPQTKVLIYRARKALRLIMEEGVGKDEK
jgi:RNA polymerase sigma-70 factor (ECF subfamily)